tara:strand:+ start:208 stop:420 length:213 start_codon:yes stop_codon:yes gene_type:complete
LAFCSEKIKWCSLEPIIKTLPFGNLAKTLNLGLSVIDGELHVFYSQFNGTESLERVVVAYKDDKPIGCGT